MTDTDDQYPLLLGPDMRPLDHPPTVRLRLIYSNTSEIHEAIPCSRPEAAAAVARKIIGDEPQEVMIGLYLTNRNELIQCAELHRGTISRASVEPRQALCFALLLNAPNLIIAHNHPSGQTTPSPEDIAYTRRLTRAGDILGIRLVDHIIIGDRGRWESLERSGSM